MDELSGPASVSGASPAAAVASGRRPVHWVRLAVGCGLLLAGCVHGPPRAGATAVLHPASSAEFRELVQRSRKPVLAVFTSASCVVCRTMAPTLESLAAEYAGRLIVVEADLALTGGLISDYNLIKVPTVLVLRHGREVARRQTLLPPALMRPFIDAALSAKAQ